MQSTFTDGERGCRGNHTVALRRLVLLIWLCCLAARVFALDLRIQVETNTDTAKLMWYPDCAEQAASFQITCYTATGEKACTIAVDAQRTVFVLTNVSGLRIGAVRVKAVSPNGEILGCSPLEKVHRSPWSGGERQPDNTFGAQPGQFASSFAHSTRAFGLGTSRVRVGLAGSETPFAVAALSMRDTSGNIPAPNNSGQGPKADVVFMIDTSGSMASRLHVVYTNLLLFADALEATGIDFQLGLILFGQASNEGAPQIIGGGLTSDKEQFSEWIEPLNSWTDWGGNEPGFEAIRLAIETYLFRSNAHRAFILISDEDSDDLDKTNTVQLILSNGIVVHTAVDCDFGESTSHYCDETSVRGVSGGLLIQPIEGPYDDVIFTFTGTLPIIRKQPASQTNSFGATATLNVLAIGSMPISYQWRKNDTNLVDTDRIWGVNNPELVISNLHGGDSGGYNVVVSNAYGSVTSAVAILTVTDPLLTNLPGEIQLMAGQTLELRANALGSLPLSYQWRKDGTNLSDGGRVTGATNHILTIANCYGVDSGAYSVVVSNQYNCITNSIAAVTVLDPAIVVHPTNQNKNIGQTATFSVAAVGTLPISYRWFKDGTPVVGATNATLVITNLQLAHAGSYVAIVTNIFGAATSAVAFLVVNLTQPDTGFNPGADAPVHCFALQPDGKIIVGGEFTQLAGQTRTRLGRLLADGTIDPGFSPVITGLGDTVVNCLGVLPDGKILVGGYFGQVDSYNRTNIARLNPDGTCDATFDLGADRPVNCFAFQPDGRVIVGGWFNVFGGVTRSYLARLNPDGSLDSSFAPVIVGDESAAVYSVAVQPDGKIVVAGRFTSVNGGDQINIARLNADGSLDHTFSPAAMDDLGSVQAVAVQPDGKIILAGCFNSIGGETRRSIGRLNSNGTLDIDFDPGSGCIIDALALQSDGRILVCGSFTVLGGTARSCLGRLYPDGKLDPSFIPEVGVLYSSVHALALQRDGNVLVGGRFNTLGGANRTNLARLINTPAASHSLTLIGTTLKWLRASASPEICWAAFDFTTNGTDWISLGVPTRVFNGWELTGVQIMSSGSIRARGCTVGGKFNGSTWFTEDQLAGPVIFAHPASSTNVIGTTATFSVVAVGRMPLEFQWYKQTVPIVGATNATLVLENVQTNQIGYYHVTVSNSHGSVTSAVAQLMVVYPTTNFANSAPIQLVLGANRAVPYPSQIVVNGLWGTIDSVGITLSNLTHTAPADLDVVLVGPQGHRFMLMSDAGGTVPVTNLTLHFSAFATNVLPMAGPIVSGHYRPTDYVPADSMPAPAPGGPYSTNLALLQGTNPNGTWSLFVADDNPDHYVGSIQGGWSLTIGIGPLPPPVILTADGYFGFTNGLFGFNLSGPAGWQVVVQGSTNLLDWVPLQTNLLGTAPVYFADPTPANHAQRFYRAVIVP